MKVELHGYDHSDNGFVIQVIGETDAEKALLRFMWKHGKLETNYSGQGIRWAPKEQEAGDD